MIKQPPFFRLLAASASVRRTLNGELARSRLRRLLHLLAEWLDRGEGQVPLIRRRRLLRVVRQITILLQPVAVGGVRSDLGRWLS